MNRPVARFLLLPLAFALSLAACENESTSPEGSSSTVVVRAYVDANGTGTFDAGDVAVVGANVTLTSSDGATVTVATDATGLATFENVHAGTYTAAFAGTTPQGAVLTSATSPVVVAPFEGSEEPVSAEFRFAFNPGTVSGTLYRDNNGNGTLDATDTRAGGIAVSLTPVGGSTPVATTTTNAQGVYTFSGVRPGSYTVTFTPFPTIQIVGGNSQTVVVPAAGSSTLDVKFTGNLLVTIAQARANPPLDSATVAVEGVVTAGLGVQNARSIYIQDATGGILVFGVDTATVKPLLGQNVRVVGKVIAFNQELEIIQPTVTILGTGTLPAPRNVTGADVNGLLYQGELVKASLVQVVSVGTVSSSGGYNVTVQDINGATFVVRVPNNSVGVPSSTWVVGRRYDVTGIMIRFNTTGQILVRMPSDVVPVSGLISIAEAKLKTLGDTIFTLGVATVDQGPLGAGTIYIQDATAGIQVFNVPTTAGVKAGDIVTVKGLLGQFGGELEVVRFAVGSDVIVTKIGTTAVPTPRVVTGAQLVTPLAYCAAQTPTTGQVSCPRQYEGQLVQTLNARLTNTVAPTGTTSYNLSFVAADGTAFQVRVETPLATTTLPRTFWDYSGTAIYDITGLVASNVSGAGNVYNVQIKVRGTADIVKK
jgi:DNA/RNA endonuclease YhcR with UshA esterase domain